METWLKSKADQLAQAAQDHVSAVQQSASKLVAFDAARASEDLKDLEFRDGPLGFTLEGSLVVAVQPSTQAERLGVEIGDRLVKIDGYEVPRYETDFEEQRARKVIAKWLKEMPRPAILTFELPEQDDEETNGPCGADLPERSEEVPKAGAVQVLQAELQRIQEERKKLAAELKDSQETCGQLVAQVESLKKESAPNLRRLSEMEEQVQTLRTQNKELVSAVNASSASRTDEEMLKLRQALAATQEASQAAVQAAQAETAAAEQKCQQQAQEVKSLMLQLADVTACAESRKLQIEPLEKELQGFRAAHEAELDLYREEQERRNGQHRHELEELQHRLEEQELKAEKDRQEAQTELQRSKEALLEAKVNAEAAAVEAAAARHEAEALRSVHRPEPDSLNPEPDGIEVGATPEMPAPAIGDLWDGSQVLEMQKRINLLESRCATLQRRLRSQDALTGVNMRPSWELRLAALTGTQFHRRVP
ncbi:unnamed protein product [Symbiodinium natans]|uniref:PDZ domain-containing protein n=1 Tax=Symbiodinium natans TaxID=878477 RepID=A0A812J1Y7_9DINO|nr:unnamed protein product [Symbiodinium natans]